MAAAWRFQYSETDTLQHGMVKVKSAAGRQGLQVPAQRRQGLGRKRLQCGVGAVSAFVLKQRDGLLVLLDLARDVTGVGVIADVRRLARAAGCGESRAPRMRNGLEFLVGA